MDEAMRELLDALEAAEAQGAPLTDTVIREALLDAIHRGFVVGEAGYRVPGDLLLNYTEAAARQNEAVISALDRFLEKARLAAAADGLDTPESRESAIFGSEVESSSGEVNAAFYFD